MQITGFSDLSFRILITLCQAGKDHPITVGGLSELLEKPHSSVVKAVHFMSRQGWLYARRGRLGGVTLQSDPELMRAGDLLGILEGREELAGCDSAGCNDRTDCALRQALRAGLESFYDKLNEYTLADLAAAQGTQFRVRFSHPAVLTKRSEVWS